eukprot:GGOE01019906.1.p1 GENE.GGOE01019906.1~~GGOE01019906.1.p1  ORF type:complete len:1264 (+),score=336.72 GGOE01019906.1:532-3792(+)
MEATVRGAMAQVTEIGGGGGEALGDHSNVLSVRSPRSPRNTKASSVKPSAEPASAQGSDRMVHHGGAERGSHPHQHPQVVARREAEARHKEELRRQLSTTRRQALSRAQKLQAEERAVRAQVDGLEQGKAPAVTLSVAEFMQKAWEHKEYPTEALVAEHARKKRRPARPVPLGRTGSLAPDGEQSPRTKESSNPTVLWTKHSAKARMDTQFHTPSLVETAGHLKTVSAPPLLPSEGSGAPQSPAQPTVPPTTATTTAATNTTTSTTATVVTTVAPASPPTSQAVGILSEPSSPHELKFPGDIHFTQRTARASTIVQRQYRKQVEEHLSRHQGHIHTQFQVKVSKEHLPDVDDLVSSSSESDSEGDEAPSAAASPPLPPAVTPLPEVAACMLEDVVTFLCQEADHKRQGRIRGQKDINVMRNVLVQALKLLMPHITTLSPDPLPSPRSPTRRTARVSTPLGPDQQAGNPLSTSRTLRSWTKGVEVLLMWDLDMQETLSLNNEAHLRRIALYYCKLKAQIRRRMSLLMSRWQGNRASHVASEPEVEQRPEETTEVDSAHSAALQQRWTTVGAYLTRIATDKSAPEAPAVKQFLERYAMQSATPISKPAKPHGFSIVKKSVLGSRMEEQGTPPSTATRRDSLAVAGRLFASIWGSAVPGTALQPSGQQGWHGRAEEQHRRVVKENQDVMAIVTKYIRLTAEAVQGRFRGIVLSIKQDIQAGTLVLDDEVEVPEPSIEARERQRQLEDLEDTLAHRLLEVERDRLLKKYAHQFREKEDQLGRFYDVLRSSHIWSSSLHQRGNGVTSGDPKDEGARMMERESIQAQRMKKYDQFRRVHEQRLEQMDALARQIIPVTVQAKPAPTESPTSSPHRGDASPAMTVLQLRERLHAVRTPGVPGANPTGEGAMAELAAVPPSNSPPTTEDLSQLTIHELRVHRLKELDVIWSALKVEFQEKLALYGKYDSPALPIQSLDLALARWRSASEAVLTREQALQELEMYNWQSLSISQSPEQSSEEEAEERLRTAMFTRFCQAGLQCESCARRLELDVGDELKYKGRPYLARMKEDYLRILSAIERRKADLQPPPTPDLF